MNIALEAELAKLPIGEIKATIREHIRPLGKQLPDKRLVRVVEDMVLGILGSEMPVITEIAGHNSKRLCKVISVEFDQVSPKFY